MSKELSSFVKTLITLAIVFSLGPYDTLRELSPYNPFAQLQEWFLQTIKPRMERNVVEIPEAFMTSVNAKL
jgi:hypothetical protein